MADIETVEGMMTEARYFLDTIVATPTDFSVTAAQSDTLKDLVQNAEGSFAARTAVENSLITSRAAFKTDIDLLSKFFRPLRQSVKDNPDMTDTKRAQLHLDTDDGGSAPDLGDPLALAPLVFAETAGVHQQLVRFFMQGEASNSTKKPKGVFGAKIYQKIDGSATTDLKDYSLITTDTKSPYIYEFDAGDAGKTAHYICRWVDKDDNASPQSEVFSIVIT